MMSIPETLVHHRRTRSIYMSAARRAENTSCFYYESWGAHLTCGCGMAAYSERMMSWHRLARDCFIRHARAANRKLIAVKRFQREMSRAISLGYEPNGDEGDYLLSEQT